MFVVYHGRQHSRDFVGQHGHADAVVANEDGTVDFMIAHGSGGGDGIVRVVVEWIKPAGAVINDLMPHFFQFGFDNGLDFKAAVV